MGKQNGASGSEVVERDLFGVAAHAGPQPEQESVPQVEQQVAPQEEEKIDPVLLVTGDSQAKLMGKAKSGGFWYKNYSSGNLYRIQDGKLMETKRSGVSSTVTKAQTKKQTVEEKAPKVQEPAKEEIVKEPTAAAKKPKEGSRAALLERAQGRGYKYIGVMLKSELAEILATHDQMTIDGIIKKAKERYLQCSYFQKKVVKE